MLHTKPRHFALVFSLPTFSLKLHTGLQKQTPPPWEIRRICFFLKRMRLFLYQHGGDFMSATILASAHQTRGGGKPTTTANLGIELARTGKRVLLIDADPQASLTISLGYANPDDFPVTLTQLLQVTAKIGAPRPGDCLLYTSPSPRD